jgi:hypothetical protein
MLEIVRNRSDRRGRHDVVRLVAEHGPDCPVPDRSADCPGRIENSSHDVRGVNFPT